MKIKTITFTAFLCVICAVISLLGGIILKIYYHMQLSSFISLVIGAIFLFLIAITLEDIAYNFKKIEKKLNQEKDEKNTSK